MMLMVKRCAPVKRRWSTGTRTTSGASEESGPRLPLCQGDQLTPYGSQCRDANRRDTQMLAKVVSVVLRPCLQKKTSLLKIDSFWFCQSDQLNTSEHFLREANLENINGPKALSTLTHSTHLVQSRSFIKLCNFGQISSWFCLANGKKNKFDKS